MIDPASSLCDLWELTTVHANYRARFSDNERDMRTPNHPRVHTHPLMYATMNDLYYVKYEPTSHDLNIDRNNRDFDEKSSLRFDRVLSFD